MRKRKKAPVDSYIAAKQFKKLEAISANGWDIAKVLDKATVNNWTDVFEPTPGRDDDMRSPRGTSRQPTIAGGNLFARLQSGEITREQFDAERAKLTAGEPPPRRPPTQSAPIGDLVKRYAGQA